MDGVVEGGGFESRSESPPACTNRGKKVNENDISSAVLQCLMSMCFSARQLNLSLRAAQHQHLDYSGENMLRKGMLNLF